MDLNSAPTGNTCFVLTEIYESKADVADHFEQTTESWVDFPAMGKWMEKCSRKSGKCSSWILRITNSTTTFILRRRIPYQNGFLAGGPGDCFQVPPPGNAENR